ncbi:Ectodysplasin-A [Orchesella cincta]|uniref:Ectodysplasin-A n=1 Tax=Orchesella cincta TaxID=48709 RepID=A0A1D2N9Y8_ORCCI|nr:Ectodysplasin-A [Orchesella cincta]
MKPEFSEVLIPASKLHNSPSTDSSIRYIGVDRSNTTMSKNWIVAAIILAFAGAIITTAFIVRYEDRLNHYEHRISSLEKELSTIYEMWEEEYGPLHVSEKDFEYEIPTHSNIFGSDENTEDEYLSKEDEHHIVRLHENKEHGDDVQSRKKRQIPFPTVPTYGPEVERTSDGVPIIETSYLDRTDTRYPAPVFTPVEETTDSEGLRLYEGLVATGGRNEPRSLDFAGSNSGILPHHRTSAAWSERESRTSSGIQLKSGDSYSNVASGFGESSGPQISDELQYRRTSSGRRGSSGTGSRTGAGSSASYSSSSSTRSSTLIAGGAPGTYHRSSRVPATSDFLYPSTSQSGARSVQYPPLKRLGQGDGEVIARVLQTDSDNDSEVPNSASASASYGETASAHSESRRRQGSRRVTPKRQAGFKHARKIADSGSGEISIVKAEAWVEGPAKAVAAHYVADVSNFTTSHRHYEGNGRLRNADGIFASWKPSDWMETKSADEEKNFVLNKNGVLTVKKSGLYYVYAQIHYLDEHDINGYIVQVNTTPFLQCTTMTETNNAGSKSNSCFTAGITHLKENDRLIVKDIEANRYSIFKPEKSFFGLMKIGEASN